METKNVVALFNASDRNDAGRSSTREGVNAGTYGFEIKYGPRQAGHSLPKYTMCAGRKQQLAGNRPPKASHNKIRSTSPSGSSLKNNGPRDTSFQKAKPAEMVYLGTPHEHLGSARHDLALGSNHDLVLKEEVETTLNLAIPGLVRDVWLPRWPALEADLRTCFPSKFMNHHGNQTPFSDEDDEHLPVPSQGQKSSPIRFSSADERHRARLNQPQAQPAHYPAVHNATEGLSNITQVSQHTSEMAESQIAALGEKIRALVGREVGEALRNGTVEMKQTEEQLYTHLTSYYSTLLNFEHA